MQVCSSIYNILGSYWVYNVMEIIYLHFQWENLSYCCFNGLVWEKNKGRSSWGRRAFFNAQRLKNLHFVRVVKMHLPRGVSEVTFFLPHRAYIAFKALDRCETQSFFSWDRHCQLRMYCSKCGLIRLLKRPVVSKMSGIHFLMLFQEERHEIILF